MPILFYSKETQRRREKTQQELKKHISQILGKPEKYRVLFLAANPSDTKRLNLGKEFDEIKGVTQQHKNLTLALPTLALRPRDLLDHLLKQETQILHFSGHGSKEGKLIFENENGKALPASPEALENLFKHFSGKIQCVILNACYSEKQARAIAKHIDYVIGTRQSISDKAASDFSVGFYQALGAGESIESAFEAGKSLSGLTKAAEFDTPVLLGRAVKK